MLIQGVLLAAGAARRFGGDKLVQPLPDGTPLGIAALRSLRSALGHVVCVVRAGDERGVRIFEREPDVRLVVCPDADKGMAHSLVCGVCASFTSDGWIIALADMPMVRPETHSALAMRLRAGANVVVPYFRGRRGNPVAFSNKYRSALLDLTGDTGARHVLESHPEAVTQLEVDDPGVLRDVDTPQDLEGLAGC